MSLKRKDNKDFVLGTLSRAVRALTPTIRSFNNREKGLNRWEITREDDVRDLLYAMLKPSWFDLVKEEHLASVAGTHKIVDLCSRKFRTFIEVKWIAKRGQWKSIVHQMKIDLQSYPVHECCDRLAFIVVDEARDIPDPWLIQDDLSGEQTMNGRTIDVRVYVASP